ncbi:MAG TPA: hypothetical protein PLL78_06595 [Fimbriimonadaceae bacterium]|nr:hypothetical protein [Fimbriimonadaceae bacterium]HRJ96337.1 hypothetical protein [Fimbriimonadaceae bacterium]
MKRFATICGIVATLGLVGGADAQLPMPVQKDGSKLKVAHAKRVARIDRNFRIISDWVTIPQQGVNPQSVNFSMAWDATDADPSALPNSIYTQFYGVTSGLWYFGDTFNNPFQINDVTLNPSASGKSATLIQLTNTWNPGASSPPSGNANLTMAFFSGHGFNPITDVLDGIVVDFGDMAGNYYWLQVDLAGTGIGLPLCYGTGNLWTACGSTVGGNFQMAPGVTQPDLRNMCSPGEAQFPGTNPSSSTHLEWLDINPSDFTIAANEFYTLDYTGSNIGILQTVAGLFIDTDIPTISGQITLQDIDPFTLRPVTSIRVVVTEAGNPTNVVSDQTVALGPNGEFCVVAPLNSGNYDVYAVPTHWLIRAAFGVSYSGSSVTGVNISCENGDSDMDNEIAIGDFSLISAAFGSTYDTGTGTPTGPWDFMADLNHDDEVNIGDYAIMSANFGMTGD